MPFDYDVSVHFSDPDGEPLTFSASGLPPSLSIDPDSGVISGAPTLVEASQSPFDVSARATDPSLRWARYFFRIFIVGDGIFCDGFESGDASAWAG